MLRALSLPVPKRGLPVKPRPNTNQSENASPIQSWPRAAGRAPVAVYQLAYPSFLESLG